MRRTICVYLAAAALLGVFAQTASASVQDRVFDPTCVSRVDLTAPQSSIDALKLDPQGTYQPATMTFVLCGSPPQQYGPMAVTFHLKGSGSFRDLDGKAAFKIKVPAATRIDGLKSITLNNMVQDESALHEALAYTAFRAAGVKSVRSGFAMVTLNGKDYGLHADVESADDRYLNANFGSFQHLFEPEDWATPGSTFARRDILPASVPYFVLQEGSAASRSDLQAAGDAMGNAGDDDWWTAFQQKFDVDESMRFWATELYLGDSDNYPAYVNNYFLYDSTGGVFGYLPWGTDKSFTTATNTADDLDPSGTHSAVIYRCMHHAPCHSAYRAALSDVAETLIAGDLVTRAHEIYDATAAWLVADTAKEQSDAGSCNAAKATVSFLIDREALWAGSFRGPTSGITSAQSSAPITCPSSETVAPTVTVSAPANGLYTAADSITLLYAASDDSGVAPACTIPNGAVIPLTAGDNWIDFTCTDVAKNAASVSVRVIRDNSPPVVTITAPRDGASTTDHSATLRYTASDDSGVAPTCDRADGSAVALVNGANPISVECSDAAANSAGASVTLTRIPPVAAVSINAGARYTRKRAAVLDLTWPDGATSALVSGRANFAAPRTIGVQPSLAWQFAAGRRAYGTLTAFIRFRDSSGAAIADASDSIAYDAAKPRVTSLKVRATGGAEPVRHYEITLRAADKGSGVARVQVRGTRGGAITSSPYVRGTSVPVDSASRTAVVRVVDRAGNVGAWQVVRLRR